MCTCMYVCVRHSHFPTVRAVCGCLHRLARAERTMFNANGNLCFGQPSIMWKRVLVYIYI